MTSWCGTLTCDDTALEDIRLVTSHALPVLPTDAGLRYVTLVDITRVPLCTIAGPSCDVFTENEVAEEWFAEQLSEFGHITLDSTCSRHTSIGILTQVIDSTLSSIQHPITHIIFYTAVSSPSDAQEAPTPPPSSPAPGHAEHDSGDVLQTVCLRALPISSQILQGLPTPPLSPSQQSVPDESQFLPTFQELQKEEEQSRKRKQISDVFEEATTNRKKARKTVGQCISAAAAKGDSVNLLIPKKPLAKQAAASPVAQRDTKDSGQPAPQTERATGGTRSRSASNSSETRPISRRGLLESQHKRSSLSRVTSFAENANDTEMRNKETISRIVMAGMRLYGLQQRKKTNHSRRGSDISGIERATPGNLGDKEKEDLATDEEYKIIYHQTYKSTVCAFRQSIANEHLYQRPEVLQDVVDRLLGIFCADPVSAG